MKKLVLLMLCALFFGTAPAWGAQQSYAVQKVTEGVYAALALPGGHTSSNAFFVIGDSYVLAAGAHFTRGAITDLVAAVATVTPKPIRFFVLAHHHRGFSHIDVDFPPDREVIMSWQTWQAVSTERGALPFPTLFFNDGLTLKIGGHTVILYNLEKGHSEGDVLVYLPETQVLFTSDLAYFDSVGYLGEGHMQAWMLALDFMEGLDAKQVVPGYGPVGNSSELTGFRVFMQDFLTAVLGHIEAGDSLEKTLKDFSLAKYQEHEGYRRFLRSNIERAYLNLRQGLDL